MSLFIVGPVKLLSAQGHEQQVGFAKLDFGVGLEFGRDQDGGCLPYRSGFFRRRAGYRTFCPWGS